MQIDHYISELLFKTDSITIPEFGTFKLKYAPAVIEVHKKEINPRRKNIVFNPLIKQDDKILSDFIAKKEGIPLNEAQNKIRIFVKKCNEFLQNNKIIEFKNIGRLSLDKNKKIVFVPLETSNFLPDTYGMKPVKAQPIEKKDNAYYQKVDTKHPNKRKYLFLWIILAFFLLLVIGTTAFSFIKPRIAQNIWIDIQGLFSKKHTTTQQNYSDEVLAMPHIFMVAIDSSSLKSRTFAYTDLEPDYQVPFFVKDYATIKNSLPKQLTMDDLPKGKYHLIAGSFSYKSNAEKFVNNLKSRGYKNSRIVSSGQYYRVCFNSYDSKQNALNELAKLKRNVDNEAWLYIH